MKNKYLSVWLGTGRYFETLEDATEDALDVIDIEEKMYICKILKVVECKSKLTVKNIK